MKGNLSRYTLRVDQALLDKLGYIAEYEGQTKNRELEQMIKKRIRTLNRNTARSICTTHPRSDKPLAAPWCHGAADSFCMQGQSSTDRRNDSSAVRYASLSIM